MFQVPIILDEDEGIHKSFTVIQNVFEVRPSYCSPPLLLDYHSIYEHIFKETSFFTYLMKFIQVKEFCSLKLFASELLSMCLQQSEGPTFFMKLNVWSSRSSHWLRMPSRNYLKPLLSGRKMTLNLPKNANVLKICITACVRYLYVFLLLPQSSRWFLPFVFLSMNWKAFISFCSLFPNAITLVFLPSKYDSLFSLWSLGIGLCSSRV